MAMIYEIVQGKFRMFYENIGIYRVNRFFVGCLEGLIYFIENYLEIKYGKHALKLITVLLFIKRGASTIVSTYFKLNLTIQL